MPDEVEVGAHAEDGCVRQADLQARGGSERSLEEGQSGRCGMTHLVEVVEKDYELPSEMSEAGQEPREGER